MDCNIFCFNNTPLIWWWIIFLWLSWFCILPSWINKKIYLLWFLRGLLQSSLYVAILEHSEVTVNAATHFGWDFLMHWPKFVPIKVNESFTFDFNGKRVRPMLSVFEDPSNISTYILLTTRLEITLKVIVRVRLLEILQWTFFQQEVLVHQKKKKKIMEARQFQPHFTAGAGCGGGRGMYILKTVFTWIDYKIWL